MSLSLKWEPIISGEIRSLAEHSSCWELRFLTNIGEAHIEHLGSKEGILKAKSEMLEYMQPDGHVFINGDDPYLKTLRDTRMDVTAFGLGRENDIYAKEIHSRGLGGTDFVIHVPDAEFKVHVPSPGSHMIYNALAAAAAGLALGMAPDEIAAGLAAYRNDRRPDAYRRKKRHHRFERRI